MTWAPILEDGSRAAAQASEAALAVADAIFADEFASQEHGWQTSYEGALLFGYLARVQNSTAWSNRAIERLEAVDASAPAAGHLGLFGGLCGLGWTVEHVSTLLADIPQLGEFSDASTEGEPDLEADGTNSDIDAVVLRALEADRWAGRHDLISGLVGLGVYCLERLPAIPAQRGLKLIVDQLERNVESADRGCTWRTPPELLPDWQRQLCPDGYYNLGVAHGIPGIIYLLHEISIGGVETDRADRLLCGAVDWLIAQRRPAGSPSLFGNWTPESGRSDPRSAWCYGDLGILAVLLPTARYSRRRDWQEFAERLLEHCLARPFEHSGVTDVGVCHGAAGVAHMFNRLYHDGNNVKCRDAAIMWLERALSMREPTARYGGFQMDRRSHGSGPPLWHSSPSFLTGSIGVALALLAATTSVAPNWDRLLLLSGGVRPS